MSALSAPKPTYPSTLLEQKLSGVAVAAVLVDATGKPETVVVLEAPDPLMAQSVRDAVRQWTLRPPLDEDGRPLPVAAKLTFYFQIRGGSGVVLNPDEMPNGPRWMPEPASGPPASPPAARPAVRMGGHDISALAIDRTEFERRALLSSTVILDPRERDAFRRGHTDGAINIPGDELPVRARIELPLDKAVIVDCSHADEISCVIGATRLSDAGFQVSVLR